MQALSLRASQLSVLLAAVMWSTSGLFAKAPIFEAWPVAYRGLIIAFWRTLFAGIVLIPFVRRPRFHWLLIPAALLFAAMSVTYLLAITRTTAANAIWLQQTAPVWVVVMTVLVLRDPLIPRDWMMLGIVCVGVGMIVFCELYHSPAGSINNVGVALGLVSGICYAGVVVTVRALRQLDSAWLIASNHLLTALILIPVVTRIDVVPTQRQYIWLAVFGIFQMGIPYVVFARGVRGIPGHQAAFIALLEPVLVPIWVWLAWRHHPSYQPPAWWTYVGGALILIGLIIRFAPWPRGPREVKGRQPEPQDS